MAMVTLQPETSRSGQAPKPAEPVSPLAGLTLLTAEHVFWRQNTNDAVYNLQGGVVRAAGASDASFIGNEFDIVLNWQIDRHTSGYIGWAHFFAGDFLEQTGGSRDADFLYASLTYTF